MRPSRWPWCPARSHPALTRADSTVGPTGSRNGELPWMPLTHWRVLRTLHNSPLTAAFGHGRMRPRSFSIRTRRIRRLASAARCWWRRGSGERASAGRCRRSARSGQPADVYLATTSYSATLREDFGLRAIETVDRHAGQFVLQRDTSVLAQALSMRFLTSEAAAMSGAAALLSARGRPLETRYANRRSARTVADPGTLTMDVPLYDDRLN